MSVLGRREECHHLPQDHWVSSLDGGQRFRPAPGWNDVYEQCEWGERRGKNSPSTCKSQSTLNWTQPARQFSHPSHQLCRNFRVSCVGEAEWVTVVQNKEVQDSCPNSCASYLNFSLVDCKNLRPSAPQGSIAKVLFSLGGAQRK